MRSSTSALVALSIIVSSASHVRSAPAPSPFNLNLKDFAHLNVLQGPGPVLSISASIPSATSPPTQTGSANKALQSILDPDNIEPIGLIPLPIHNNRRVDVKARNERRDAEDLVRLLVRALGDDESDAFSLSSLKGLAPIAHLGGSIFGIGSDLHNIFSSPAPAPAPVAPAAPVSAASPVQRRSLEARDIDELMQLLARSGAELDESGAFSISSIFKPLTSILGGLFGGGSAPPPPPPPPAPAPVIASQPAQKRDALDVTAILARRDFEEFIELVARAASEDGDLESGASIFSSILKGVERVFENPTVKTIGKALDTASTVTGAVSGIKSLLTPPPAPAPVAPAAAPVASGPAVSTRSSLGRRDLEEFMELVARAASEDGDLESGASIFSTILSGAEKFLNNPTVKSAVNTLDTVGTVTGALSGLKSLVPPAAPAPAPVAPVAAPAASGSAVSAPPPAARSLNELD